MVKFLFKQIWLYQQITLSKSTDWRCTVIPFQKQLSDCAMEFLYEKTGGLCNHFLFETTDWLCDGILFSNDWLTARWNSFCKQPTSCLMYLLVKKKGLLCDEIPFQKELNASVIEDCFWVNHVTLLFLSPKTELSRLFKTPASSKFEGVVFFAEFGKKLVSILLDLSCCSFFLPFSAKICPNFYVNKAVNTTIFRWNWRKSSFELQLFRVLGKLTKV